MSLPNEVATADKAAPSPSGQYLLQIVAAQDSDSPAQRFQITDPDGTILFSAPDSYATRHTTYFLWDEAERVWVYSGDLGTFFWERDPASDNWQKHTYFDSEVGAPSFLKELRPSQHPR